MNDKKYAWIISTMNKLVKQYTTCPTQKDPKK